MSLSPDTIQLCLQVLEQTPFTVTGKDLDAVHSRVTKARTELTQELKSLAEAADVNQNGHRDNVDAGAA